MVTDALMEDMTFLVENKMALVPNSFADSICSQFIRNGCLSDAQWAHVPRVAAETRAKWQTGITKKKARIARRRNRNAAKKQGLLLDGKGNIKGESDGRVFVYCIQQDAKVKIGISNNPFRRCANLQVGSATPLLILWQVPALDRFVAKSVEGHLHQHFRDSKFIGEWFPVGVATDAHNLAMELVAELERDNEGGER